MRVGPAKAWSKYQSTGTDAEDEASNDDHWCGSDFEENDHELTEYLEANTNFVMAMQATAAFSASQHVKWNCCCLCLLLVFCSFLTNSLANIVEQTQDLSGMVRKYLPPGTLYELFQFYSGWCDAHNVQDKASCLGPFLEINPFVFPCCPLFLLFSLFFYGGTWLGQGMLPSCGGGTPNGHSFSSSAIAACFHSAMCVRN